jgi:hypothetical protein
MVEEFVTAVNSNRAGLDKAASIIASILGGARLD